MSLLEHLDHVRSQQGLLLIGETIELSRRGNVIYDPSSVLVSRHAIIGSGNTFFPGVYLFCSEDAGRLSIGDGNVLYPNTLIEASLGNIQIGNNNQFGDGGFTARANRNGASITIGDEGRFMGGATILGATNLGSGSQLLGAITADNCTLEAGGSHREPNPDRRAGLLKGSGLARGLSVPVGHVVVGAGAFVASDLQLQSNFHPKAAS
ncbi:hypothetical protein IB279_13680 [Ensifer sp. ENS06]|uniref:hypothetical protein n=1 Tax=Ensifer sp. ENS06 TaxID=2769276 RepID=UPI0017827FD3|nr:hypothetical protein [Ensifer sp. ENS06]MBD9623993.1 hypothetical protein [Ensifer sp. ENS06]